MRNKDFIAFAIIYLITFGIILQYNLSHPLVNDGVFEYRTYLMNIDKGWEYRYPNSVSSCLIPLWVPSLIQSWTNWDAMLLFRVFPAFFYPLMPAFAYLIARRYLSLRESIIASLVIIFSSSIFFFPDIGRVGIALGFMAGMVWGLLKKRLLWASVFGALVVFSHYGTAMLSIIIVGFTCVAYGIILLVKRVTLRKCYLLVMPYLVVALVLVGHTGVWHFGIAKYSGATMLDALFRPADLQQSEMAKELMGSGFDLFKLEDRDVVTQEAFGKDFWARPLPVKIEIVVNWLVVMFITFGLFLMLKNKMIDLPFKIMSASLYGLILATIAIPQLSIYYGTQRVYFTALVVLASCLPFSISWLAKRIRLPALYLFISVLGLYAVSTSGVIYLPFGLVKTFPVVVTLP